MRQTKQNTQAAAPFVLHRALDLDGIRIFYRDAGAKDAPVVLLPHGYPWGPQDGYMPEESARAYLRDLPDAELHLLDGGHWALETNLDEIVIFARDFLGRVHAPRR